MCCLIHQNPGKLDIQPIDYKTEENKYIVKVKGVIDRTPTTEKVILRCFQRIELVEKIAEIADESFHLFGSLLQNYTPIMIYQTCCNLHHAAHNIEHLLHSFCSFGDLTVLLSGKFSKNEKGEDLHYLLLIARTFHAFSHFLATACFIKDHKLLPLGQIEKILNYRFLFSATGYAITTLFLISHRNEKEIKKHLYSDLAIHLGGFLFQALPLTESISSLAPYSASIKSLAAFAGIIHAWSSVNRLMPQDKEEIIGELEIPDDFFTDPRYIHTHSA